MRCTDTGGTCNSRFRNSYDSAVERIKAAFYFRLPHCGLLQWRSFPLSAPPATSHCLVQVGKPIQSNVHSVFFRTGRALREFTVFTWESRSRHPMLSCLQADVWLSVMAFVRCLSQFVVFGWCYKALCCVWLWNSVCLCYHEGVAVFLCHSQHNNSVDYVAAPFLGCGLSPSSLTLRKGKLLTF